LNVGSLVRFELHHKNWALCGRRNRQPGTSTMSEIPIRELEGSHLGKLFRSFEGKLGVIAKVERNHLDQPVTYHVLVGNDVYLCSSIAADKYLSLVSRNED